MKNTNMCPKCESQDIICIPGRIGPDGVGNNIPVSWFSAIKVSRYLCTDCGYSEEWIDGKTDRETLRQKYGR